MITIDKEFESLIPPLTQEEFTQLEENCVKDGIRDPLVVWKVPNGDQILIDGHNRWKISAKHSGIPFQIKEMQFDDRNAARLWIIRNQLGRRNISTYARAELALTLKEMIAAQAKQRMSDGGKGKQISADLKGQARDELAAIAKVSHDTIHKVEVISNSGNEELKAAAKSGDVSINKAYQQIKAENEALKQKVKELEEAPPNVVTQQVEVAPADYREAKNKANAYDREVRQLNEKLKTAYAEQRNAEEKITRLQEELTGYSQKDYFRELETVATAFESHCEQFIRWVGGYVWITQNPGKLKPERRESVTNAVQMVYEWAGTMLNNLSTTKENDNEENRTCAEDRKYIEG